MVAELLHKISGLTLDQLRTLRDRINRLIKEKEELETWSVPTKPGREVIEFRRVGTTCYQLEKIKCGKPNCKCNAGASHGPYWYAYERRGNKVKSRYLGKNFKA